MGAVMGACTLRCRKGKCHKARMTEFLEVVSGIKQMVCVFLML